MQVGPESAGAYPGPVCYGRSEGLLAVTDANLVLGRLLPSEFPKVFGPNEDAPLDAEAARRALSKLALEISDALSLTEESQ
jgi:5-oxoprolinase (ATP-hydrolysing)